MRHALLVSPCLLFAPLMALASDGPSFDCNAAQSEAEIMICNDADLARLDRNLADTYAAARAMAAETADADTAQNRLRAEQSGWVKGRDECWKASDQRACIEDAYLTRDGTLVAGWMLQDPTSTVTWACDGNPANTLVTLFFDTERPSVRFERGDSVDAGTLVPTASGAQYVGSFGRSIWIKGQEATYKDPDPDGATLQCVTQP